MGNPTSYASFLGIGLEGTPGTPVVSKYELDLVSETLHGVGEPIRSRAINRTRSVKKAVQGPYSAEGDLVVEWTPDMVTTLLYCAFAKATTGSSDPYTHVFTPGADLRSFTAQIKRDDVYFIYPGLYINRISIRAVIDQILEGTFNVQGRAKEVLYDVEKSDGAIAASSADPFVFLQGAVTLHGTPNTDTNNWDIQFGTGLQRNKGLGAGRAHNRAHEGDSTCTGSFDIVFDTVEAHRRWMGASASTYPILVGDAVQTAAAQLVYTASATRKLQIDIPKLYYTASEPAVRGREGLIIQRCQFASLYDAVTTGEFKITVINGEQGSAITTAPTAIS